MRTDDILYDAGLVLAAGYLLATRRRSPRAASWGLAGVGLLAVLQAMLWASLWYSELFRRAGWADYDARERAAIWAHCGHVALAYCLLIWAVLADRPPPASDE